MAEQLNTIAKKRRGRPPKNRDAMMPPVPTFAEVEADRVANGFDDAPDQPAAEVSEPGMGPSNITDDTIRELALDALRHNNEREDAMKSVKSANGAYRAVLKRAKKLGGDKLKQSIEDWLKERLMDPNDLSALVMAKNRIWSVMQLPVSCVPLGMFDERTSIATHLEDQHGEKSSVDEASDAYDRCYEAGKQGQPITRTGFTEESDHWGECLRGYSNGQKELMAKPGAPTAGAELQHAE